jgi:hypothetical protein
MSVAPPPTGTSTAPPEGARDTSEYRVTSLSPSMEITNDYAVPYSIWALASDKENYSSTVNFRSTRAMRLCGWITENYGDEPANGRKGVVSGTSGGIATPITSSPIVRINGSPAIRDGDLFEMDKASPEGPGNTIGEGRLEDDTTPCPAPAAPRSWWQRTKDKAAAAAIWVAEVDDAHGHVLTRTGGLLQAVGGGVEALVGGAGGIATAPTGVGAVVGVAAVVNGADNFQAGLRTLWYGKATTTFTQEAVGKGIKAAGGSDTAVAYGEAIAGFVGPAGVASVPGMVQRTASRIARTATEISAANKAAAAARAAEEVAAAAKLAKTTEEAAIAAKSGSGGVRVTGEKAKIIAPDSAGETVTLYRGDAPGTTVIKSQAAQQHGYAGSQTIIDSGNLDDLLQSHALDSSNPPSPFISLTTDPAVAEYFAGPDGVVNEFQIPVGRAIPNPYNNFVVPAGPGGALVPESEFLVPNYIRPSEFVPP